MPWQVSGYESLGTFDSEEAAIAAAWSVTPAGGKRPGVTEAVWSVVGTTGESGVPLHLHWEDTGLGTLTAMESVMDGEGRMVFEATMVLPLTEFERALGSLSQKDARSQLMRELARKASEASGRTLTTREVSISVEAEAPELGVPSSAIGPRARIVVTGTLVEF